jgi:hypothetical protein
MVTNRIFPQKAFINAITNAQSAVATFTADHDFIVGEIVSFRVTPDFGMFQINNLRGNVLSTTSDTITVDIDTLDWDAFDYSVLDSEGTTPPTCVPCCSGKIVGANPPQIVIEDAFDNRKV